MVRSFVVFAEIVLLIIVLRTEFAQYLLSDMQLSISNWMEEVASIPDKKELAELKKTVMPQFEAMRPFQKDYINDLLTNKAKVRHFHQLYCENGDKNPYINGASLHFFCSQIQRTDLLKEG